MVFLFDLVIFPCLLRTWTTLAVRSSIFGFEQSLPQNYTYPGFFFLFFLGPCSLLLFFLYTTCITQIKASSMPSSTTCHGWYTIIFVIFHLYFPLSYLLHISTNYWWCLRQLSKTSTVDMSVAFHLFPLKLLFLGVTHLTPITGSFNDDSPRPTRPSSLPPFFPPLSCYYISSNICSHTPSILKYNDNMNRRSKRKSSSLYKDVHYISEDDKTIL